MLLLVVASRVGKKSGKSTSYKQKAGGLVLSSGTTFKLSNKYRSGYVWGAWALPVGPI